MALTDGGKLLLQRAEEIIYSLEKAKSDVMATRSNMSGKYVIGVPPSVGTVLTGPLVQKIKSGLARWIDSEGIFAPLLCFVPSMAGIWGASETRRTWLTNLLLREIRN